MTCFVRFAALRALTLALALAPAAGHAQVRYHFVPFNDPAAGPAGTSAFGLNDRGTVVGNYGDASGNTDAFVYKDGVFTTVIVNGSPSTYIYKVNDWGVSAGNFYDVTTSTSPMFVRAADGTITVLAGPASYVNDIEPWGINNYGEIVGGFTTNPSPTVTSFYGFVYKDGQYHVYTGPAMSGAFFTGVNDWGQIVGSTQYITGAGKGFLLENGKYQSLNYPGSDDTTPLSINDWGVVTGYFDKDGEAHGFIMVNGAFHKLDYPGTTHGWPGTWPMDVNNFGVVAGTYNSFSQGFLAIPVP